MLALMMAVAAGVCLGLGWLLEQVVLVYVALGLSAAGFVLVLVQAWRRWKAAKAEPKTVDGVDLEIVEQPDSVAAEDSDVVFVVPGRMRFHVTGCRLLDGKDVEQLTLEEAEDESFTACTVCASQDVAELVGG